MLMLVVFAANFLVFCHCARAGQHSCCEKSGCADHGGMMPKEAKRDGSKHSDCQGMQAVRFNLVEKQAASSIVLGEPPVMVITFDHVMAPVAKIEKGFRRSDWWVYKYGPPDLQVLYQCFLI
jgi:hypothetical protein